jgi:hypothetical protein
LEYLEAEPDDTLMGYDRVTVKDFIQNEEFYTPDPYYFELIEPKSGINWSMRAQLLDWVAEMSSDYGLKYSTFHMSANFIDRFLIADNSSTVNKKNFQLVGLTAVNIATKIEVSKFSSLILII